MIRRPPRSTLSPSSAASDVYKRQLITQVLVDEKDPAFSNPTKPIGSFYSKEEAYKIVAEKGYTFKEDAGRGYRRVVASPKPVDIVEKASINAILKACLLYTSPSPRDRG